jgi:hypothetical protein
LRGKIDWRCGFYILLAFLVLMYFLLIERFGIPLYDGYGALWTVSKASA